MGIFTAVFEAVAVTAAQDMFELVAGAATRVRIREIKIGQYSDFGDAQAEQLSVKLVRGDTVAGSGGSAATPQNLMGHSAAPAATSTVNVNNTTVANTSGKTLVADVWNVAAGWWYYPPEEEMIVLEKGQRLCVRTSAPADSLTCNATIVFEEMGQNPA